MGKLVIKKRIFDRLKSAVPNILVGTSAEILADLATHTITDWVEAVTDYDEVLFLNGTHTPENIAQITINKLGVRIEMQSKSAQIDTATYSFTSSGNECDLQLHVTTTSNVSITGTGNSVKVNGAIKVMALIGDMLPDVTDIRNLGSVANKFSNIHGISFQGEATSALYADLAEMYTMNPSYIEIGAVVRLSENDKYDVELTNDVDINDVFGIISEKPGFLLDKGLVRGVPVCLIGKIPIRVIGLVKKKDIIVSAGNGIARAGTQEEKINQIAWALETNQLYSVKLVKCACTIF